MKTENLHDEDAEVIVLGCCMANVSGDYEEIDEALDGGIGADSFYLAKHKILWGVILKLRNQLSPVDDAAIISFVRSNALGQVSGYEGGRQAQDQIAKILSIDYILSVSDRVEGTGQLPHWIGVLRDKEYLRDACTLARDIQSSATTGDKSVETLRGEIEQRVGAMGEKTKPVVSVDLCSAMRERVNTVLNTREAEVSYKTGFAGIDRHLGGIGKVQFVGLGARPSTGKTTLGFQVMMNIGYQMNQRQDTFSGLMFSLESPANQIVDRAIAARARVPLNKIKERYLSEGQRRDLLLASDHMEEMAIRIDDGSGLDINQIRSRARQHKRKHGLDLVMIDHFGLIKPIGRDKQTSLQEISHGLSDMRKELGCMVIVLIQLNRSSEKEERMPRMSDIRECGALEEDLDVALFMSRVVLNGVVDERVRRINCAKNRDGPAAWDSLLTFNGACFRFDDYAPEQAGGS